MANVLSKIRILPPPPPLGLHRPGKTPLTPHLPKIPNITADTYRDSLRHLVAHADFTMLTSTSTNTGDNCRGTQHELVISNRALLESKLETTKAECYKLTIVVETLKTHADGGT